jgi:predicted metal-dependent hydrolase
MAAPCPDYDPRYLAGILFFNRRDFFEAHEVWEDLWQECAGPERRFYQGLIQAAVALYHFGNRNVRGARKLYHSSRDYMSRFGASYLGLDVAALWDQMARCFADILDGAEPDQGAVLDPALIPVLGLDPPPVAWPDPADFVEADAEEP